MICVENLSKTFKRAVILDHLNLNIATGERIALIGANGAGKTTLIRCLLGEYTYSGKISLDGFSPREDRAAVLRAIGFVPQLPPPLKMPVQQLLDFSAAVCRSEVSAMAQVATALGLDLQEVLQRPFDRLSGGQKQKLLVSIALARDTRLLVMDEPAANLDTEARRVFFEILAKRVEGVSLIISSHRLDEVAPLVDRVIELDHGHVVLDDHVADASAINSVLCCSLRLRRSEDIVVQTLRNWGMTNEGDLVHWQGSIAAPDRLRFLGMLARYSGLVADLQLREAEHSEKTARANASSANNEGR